MNGTPTVAVVCPEGIDLSIFSTGINSSGSSSGCRSDELLVSQILCSWTASHDMLPGVQSTLSKMIEPALVGLAGLREKLKLDSSGFGGSGKFRIVQLPSILICDGAIGCPCHEAVEVRCVRKRWSSRLRLRCGGRAQQQHEGEQPVRYPAAACPRTCRVNRSHLRPRSNLTGRAHRLKGPRQSALRTGFRRSRRPGARLEFGSELNFRRVR